MANEEKLTSNPAAALFDALDDVRTGMLGIHGSEQHLQPMTHFGDRGLGKRGAVYRRINRSGLSCLRRRKAFPS
jgi:hypothetical protein